MRDGTGGGGDGVGQVMGSGIIILYIVYTYIIYTRIGGGVKDRTGNPPAGHPVDNDIRVITTQRTPGRPTTVFVGRCACTHR